MPDLLTLARRQRAQIDKMDAANLDQISRAYALMYDRLGGDIDALMKAIEAMDDPTQAAIKRLPEYRRLIRRATEELDRFTTFSETIIASSALAALGLGLTHSRALVLAATGTRFAGLRPGDLTELIRYLRPDGPLYARLKMLTGSTVDRVVGQILDGVAAGWNPRRIASAIQDAFGGGLTDALRNTRTVQLWAYRDGARANYQASGVVDKWIWYAELDDLTCGACIAEHGTLHDLTEQLDGHYNCRCAALPYIEGVTDQPETGQAWFEAKSEAEQRAILGDTKWEAWKDGKFEFSQLSQQSPSDVYGHMRSEASLKSLLEGIE